MPKTRLSAHTREILITHAKSVVRCPAEADAEQTALAALTAVTDALYAARFPAADMAALARFGLVLVQSWIELRRAGETGYRCVHVPLSKPEHLPHSTRGSCQHAIELPSEHVVWSLIRVYKSAEDAHKAAHDTKMRDYRALINDSRNFEDVVAVWPEAQAMAERMGQRAPTAIMRLGPDVLARIRADAATRASVGA